MHAFFVCPTQPKIFTIANDNSYGFSVIIVVCVNQVGIRRIIVSRQMLAGTT